MTPGRPPLPVGTWGNISVREVSPGRFRARCRFRDFDGSVRYVVRFGRSLTAASPAVKIAVKDRAALVGGGAIQPGSRVSHLAEVWLAEVTVDDSLSLTTRARYKTVAETIVVAGLGGLRLYEVHVPAVDRFIASVRTNHGVATAKTARTVLSLMVILAMRHGAMTSNPTREIRIKTGRTTRARALTPDEQDELMQGLRGDELAVAYDLVDLADFMLHSGVRIGEACALRVPHVDLAVGVVEIAATLTDFGIEERPKTTAGWRRIAVPAQTIEMIRNRIDNPAIVTDVAVFPSPLGRLRNRSNTTGDLRRALDRIGFRWVSSHTFRKTAITRLDDAGLSARQIADHVGHARPSMTQDVYMGRSVASSAAAEILSGH
jgi:integrase